MRKYQPARDPSPRSEFLTDWQILAVVESVRANSALNPRAKAALLRSLDKASHIRLSFYKPASN